MGEPTSTGAKRVVVWSTGGIGRLSIVAANERRDLELVGVWVHSADKIGKDAGELANGIPIGVAATNDVDALLALEPDCVIYAASGPERDAGAIADYERILAAGVNIVTTTSTTLINPLALRRRPSRATGSGDGGWWFVDLRIGDRARVPVRPAADHHVERLADGQQGPLLRDRPLRRLRRQGHHGRRPRLQPSDGCRAVDHASRGHQRRVRAAGPVSRRRLGRGDRGDPRVLRPSSRRASDRDRVRHRRAGTCGAIRFGAIGVVDGREAIVIDHITRLARDVGPDWPIGEQDLSYRITIDGKPNFDIWVTPTLDDPAEAGIPDMGSGAGAMLATAMRVVNAVPYVVDAEPGLLRSLEMPITVPRHAFRA